MNDLEEIDGSREAQSIVAIIADILSEKPKDIKEAEQQLRRGAAVIEYYVQGRIALVMDHLKNK